MSTKLFFFFAVSLFCKSYSMYFHTPLEILDHIIYDELSEPTETEGRGDMVLKEMIAYYSNLLDVYNYVKWKDNRGDEILNKLEKEGGPFVPKMELDGDALKTAYKWQEKDFEQLTTMLGSIKSLWRKLMNLIYQSGSYLVPPYREELMN